ncbi:hypothetical protein FACS1894207_2510 [Bacteroidia bacterium]|nr:hypothetical protein FACS1894207_2510 [Bacteroidia bacterium]
MEQGEQKLLKTGFFYSLKLKFMFYISALVGALVSFFAGCLWYSVFFGKAWQRLMGFSDEKVKTIFTPKKMILAFICEWFYAACLTGILFNASVPFYVGAIMTAIVIIFSGIKLAIFDGKGLKVILINEGYRLLSVAIMAASFAIFLH